jgi:NTP pyrophosphatase (non-canonical NTP hydrolase)
MGVDRDVIEALKTRLREFATERDWNKFHNPKDLAMALHVEAAELAEFFLWKSPTESLDVAREKRAALLEEVADVFIYLLHFSIAIECDLAAIALEKISKNESRYPIHACFGRDVKYTDISSGGDSAAK